MTAHNAAIVGDDFQRRRKKSRALIREEIGQKIARLRAQKEGTSQDALATAVNLSRTTIGNIEGGKELVPLDTLHVLLSELFPRKGWRALFSDFFRSHSTQHKEEHEQIHGDLEELLRYGGPEAASVVSIIGTQLAACRSRASPNPGQGKVPMGGQETTKKSAVSASKKKTARRR